MTRFRYSPGPIRARIAEVLSMAAVTRFYTSGSRNATVRAVGFGTARARLRAARALRTDVADLIALPR